MRMKVLGGSGHETMDTAVLNPRTGHNYTDAEIRTKFAEMMAIGAPAFARAVGGTDHVQILDRRYDPTAEEIIVTIPVAGGYA